MEKYNGEDGFKCRNPANSLDISESYPNSWCKISVQSQVYTNSKPCCPTAILNVIPSLYKIDFARILYTEEFGKI